MSIITVCYNAVNEIEKTISSVCSQSYHDIEFIVIDGGSDDGTTDIIKKYQSQISFWISEPDKGVYDAMNKGINMATGEWINFLNAGDVFFDSEVVSNVVKGITDNIDVIFGDVSIIYDRDCSYIEHAKPFYMHLPLHHNMGFNHQSSFFKASSIKKMPFDTSYLLAADYDMVIRLYRNGASFEYLPIVVANYKLGGLSDKKRRLHIYETLMVDNSDSKVKNIVLSYLIFWKKKVYSLVKKVIFRISPKLGSYVMEKIIHK